MNKKYVIFAIAKYMETVRRIGSVVLLLVFLFGISGISIFHHTCTSSNLDRVTLYADIFHEAPPSCCADEAGDPVAPSFSGVNTAIDATPCCRNVNAFLVLHIVSNQFSRSLQVVSVPVVAFCFSDLSVKSTCDPFQIASGRFQFHSPPLAGRQLVHFLHQIKIPSLPDYA